MSNDTQHSRRKFLQQIGALGLVTAASPLASLAAKEKAEERILRYSKQISSNDKIRLAVIGFGIQGHGDLATALKVPGVELAGVCDLYTGRLQNAKEMYGDQIFTTKNYQEVLDRSDVDAIIIATSDHWHARITKETLKKGKALYCEKPMVHKITEGLGVVEAHKASGKVMQVGSQRVSSIGYAKAKELYQAGEIGKLNMVNAVYDRQSAIGAWEYTMPNDASPETVDWNRYIEAMNKIPFDPKKFFWWRNYRDFGTGVAGDLFVHLLSGTHVITGSKGPEKIISTGQTAYWKDGRDVPDVMTAIMHYPDTKEHPAFELMLRVNFISGQGETSTVKFFGSEGVLDMGYDGFTIRHHKMPAAPDIGGWDALTTYPQAMQDELKRQYEQRWTPDQRKSVSAEPTVYKLPEGFDEHVEHFKNFFAGVRTGSPVVEDPIFGFRAAAPCLIANESYFQRKIVHWDAVNMQLKEA